jgi:hypothetical protein
MPIMIYAKGVWTVLIGGKPWCIVQDEEAMFKVKLAIWQLEKRRTLHV